jgi:hypothetical protein
LERDDQKRSTFEVSGKTAEPSWVSRAIASFEHHDEKLEKPQPSRPASQQRQS